MTTHPAPPKAPPNRDAIRRNLHEHIDAIFNRLFPEDPSKPLPAFDQIEDQTRQLTRNLESWLLEQRVQSAADAARSRLPPVLTANDPLAAWGNPTIRCRVGC